MAKGDFTFFNTYSHGLGSAQFDHDSKAILAGLIKSAANAGFDPADTTPDPRWGAGGTTNLASSEVVTTGSYTGPITVGGTGATITDPWTQSGSTSKLDVDDLDIAAHASNPTNARWLILYEATSLLAIGFLDLGADVDMQAGPLQINWAGTGVATLAPV